VRRAAVLVAAISWLALASPVDAGSTSAEWPQPNADAGGTSFQPFEDVITPANVGTLRRAWHDKQADNQAPAPPVVAGGLVLRAAGTLSAWPAGCQTRDRDCDPVWHVPGYKNPGQVVVVGDTVVAGGSTTLDGLALATGARRWRVPDVNPGPMVVAGGVAFLLAGSQPADMSLMAVDVADGAVLWSRPDEGLSPSDPISTDGARVFARVDYSLVAFDATDGTPVWSAGIASCCFILRPVVADGVVYVGGYDSTFAFDAATGHVVWRTRGHKDTLALGAGRLWTQFGGLTIAVDPATGDELGSVRTGYSFDLVVTPAVVIGVTDDRLFAFDAATTCDACAPSAVIQLRWHPNFLAVAGGYVYVSHWYPATGCGDLCNIQLEAYTPAT
jgi:outer membrane protein assembly factor BamB